MKQNLRRHSTRDVQNITMEGYQTIKVCSKHQRLPWNQGNLTLFNPKNHLIIHSISLNKNSLKKGGLN